MAEYLLYGMCVLLCILTCVVGIVMLSYDSKYKRLSQRVSRHRDSLLMAHSSISNLETKVTELSNKVSKITTDTVTASRIKHLENEIMSIRVYVDMLLVTQDKETR